MGRTIRGVEYRGLVLAHHRHRPRAARSAPLGRPVPHLRLDEPSAERREPVEVKQRPALDCCGSDEPLAEIAAVLGDGCLDDLRAAPLCDPAVQVARRNRPALRAGELTSLEAKLLLDLLPLHRGTLVTDPPLDSVLEDLKSPGGRHSGNWIAYVPQPISMGSTETAETGSAARAAFVAAWKGLVPLLAELGEGLAVGSVRGHPRRWVSPLVAQFTSLVCNRRMEVTLAPREYRKQKYSTFFKKNQ